MPTVEQRLTTVEQELEQLQDNLNEIIRLRLMELVKYGYKHPEEDPGFDHAEAENGTLYIQLEDDE